jgi:hypothetical protein
MMTPPLFRILALCAVTAAALPLIGRGQQPEPTAAAAPALDPKADKVLKSMGAALAERTSISFDSHAIADQYTPDGQKVQYAKNQKVMLHRPDKLAVDVTGDIEDLRFRYDGKQVALYNPRSNSWGKTQARGSIDDTLDMLAGKYGMALPLADLVFADPYACLTERVRSSQYLGVGYVFDVKCHHLAFRQESVDWQIWIEDGDRPLPRKVVITFKESPGHPQYTAFLSNWNLSAETTDATFALAPPAGAKQVDFAPTTQPATTGGGDQR